MTYWISNAYGFPQVKLKADKGVVSFESQTSIEGSFDINS